MSYKRLQPIETLDYILANFPDDGEREKAYAEVENLQKLAALRRPMDREARPTRKELFDFLSQYFTQDFTTKGLNMLLKLWPDICKEDDNEERPDSCTNPVHYPKQRSEAMSDKRMIDADELIRAVYETWGKKNVGDAFGLVEIGKILDSLAVELQFDPEESRAVKRWNDEVKDYSLIAREYEVDSIDELNFKGSEIKTIILKGDAMRDELQAQLVVLKGRAEKAETEWKYICDNWDGKMKELDEKDVEIARLKASIAELEKRRREE
jgi:hypothetical protein